MEAHGHIATERVVVEHLQLADAVTSTLDGKTLPAASGAYCGKTLDPTPIDRESVYQPDELQHDHGFQYLPYENK